MEHDELLDTERTVPNELLLERPSLRRVARREDLECELGRSLLAPRSIRMEVMLRLAELHERVRREAAPGIRRIEVHEDIAGNGVSGTEGGRQNLIEGSHIRACHVLEREPRSRTVL
jgi:hypothetical protein